MSGGQKKASLRKRTMVTIYDIARAAGVAKSTVANALSGKGTVSEATRERILRYAQEMGYRPNVLARSLYNHKTLTIALVLPSITNPFYPEIIEVGLVFVKNQSIIDQYSSYVKPIIQLG